MSRVVFLWVCTTLFLLSMELYEYTEEQLKAELRRRVELRRQERQKKMRESDTCRNCRFVYVVYGLADPSRIYEYKCTLKTVRRKNKITNKLVQGSGSCELFEREQ